MSGNNIKVVCRFRPQNKLEIKEGGVPIVEISEDGTGVSLKVIIFFSRYQKKKGLCVCMRVCVCVMIEKKKGLKLHLGKRSSFILV